MTDTSKSLVQELAEACRVAERLLPATAIPDVNRQLCAALYRYDYCEHSADVHASELRDLLSDISERLAAYVDSDDVLFRNAVGLKHDIDSLLSRYDAERAEKQKPKRFPNYCERCDGCGWYEGGPTIQTACEKCSGTGITGYTVYEVDQTGKLCSRVEDRVTPTATSPTSGG